MRVATAVSWVMLPAILGLAAWTSQEFPNRNDRYLFEHMGQTLRAGGTMYLDCWDNKPPGLGWWNAAVLSIGGGSTYAVTVAAALAGALAVLVTAWGVRRSLGQAPALLTAIVFTVVLSQRYFDALTNGTELYMMSAESVACACAVLAIRGSSGPAPHLLALAAGVAWGVAGLFKQPAIAGPTAALIGVAGMALYVGAARSRWIVRLLLAGVGAAAVMGGAIAFLEHRGALEAAYRATIEVNLIRPRPDHVIGTYDVSRSLAQLQPIAGIVLLAIVGGFVALIADRRHPPPEDAPADPPAEPPPPAPRRLGPPTIVFLLMWLVLAAYWVGVGPSHMPRYWHGVFVPMMWLFAQATVFVIEACTQGTRAGRYTVTVGAVAFGAIVLRPLLGNIYADALRARHYAESDSERAKLINLGERIAAHTDPDDRIHVWGYQPGVYRFSDRRAVTRFGGLETIYFPNEFGRKMAEEVFAKLREHPPKLIAVERQRIGPLFDDRIGEFPLPGLSAWFSERYIELESVGAFTLFGWRGALETSDQPASTEPDAPAE